MAKQETTAPLDPGERASIARLLAACRAALDSDGIGPEQAKFLAGFVRTKLDQASACVLQGGRADQLDQLTTEVKRFRGKLTSGPGAPR